MLVNIVKPRGRACGTLSGVIPSNIIYELGSMPGRKKWQAGQFLFELSGANIYFLVDRYPILEWSQEAQTYRDQFLAVREEGEQFRVAKRQDVATDYDFKFKTTPFDHQNKAFVLSRDKKNFALLMEMGCGKTKVIIDTAAYLYERGEIDLLFVLAPNGVHRNWVDKELPVHMPDFAKYKAAFWRASSKKRQRECAAVAAYTDGLAVIAGNIDMLSFGEKGIKQIQEWFKGRRVLFVIDESTRIKSPSSQRTKNAIMLGRRAAYKRILSGAPVTKGLCDLYPQFKFLDPNIIGYNSMITFKQHYCILQPVAGGNAGATEIIGYQNVEELQRKVDAFSFRVEKSQCLDLPPKMYVEREVELHPEQRRLYNDLKENLIVEYGNNTIDMASAGVRLMRLQQVLCGHVVDETRTILDVPSKRISTLLEVIEELQGRKAIIWSRYTYDIEHISKALQEAGVGFVNYYGKTSSEDRALAEKRFAEDDKVQVFNGRTSIAGIGLTLTAAQCVIYYSNSFDAEHRWQSEDRAHRIGQKNTVTYVDLVARGTMDRRILRALKEKRDIAEVVFNEGAQSFFAQDSDD